ncbi:MAG: hypothetical protein LBQ37_02585 [Elusimicrobiota bacterium]|jgi:hypothetical protein|nr:hypothetical protein [Elusimicrobiota bacterium]
MKIQIDISPEQYTLIKDTIQLLDLEKRKKKLKDDLEFYKPKPFVSQTIESTRDYILTMIREKLSLVLLVSELWEKIEEGKKEIKNDNKV